MKKRNLISFFAIAFIAVTALLIDGNALQAQDDSCPTCMEERRKHIRGCLSLWGNFADGSPGGFLATGSKTVCRRDDSNQCDADWLTGCVAKVE